MIIPKIIRCPKDINLKILNKIYAVNADTQSRKISQIYILN